VSALAPGDEVEVEVTRDGERRTFEVELGTRPGP
jgi:S1-C subfamily serine protease